MRKVIALIMSILMIILASVAVADVDISNLSYEELVALVNEAQMLMMKSDKWQVVDVPPGTYLVGKDIPAGQWQLSVYDESYVDFEIGTAIKDNGEIDYMACYQDYKHITLKGKRCVLYSEGDTTTYSIELKDGWYVVITTGSILFSPFTGNTFKFK